MGKTSEFVDLVPVFFSPTQSMTVAVYKLKDRFYAYLDRCPHQGGPACEGMTIGDAQAEILSDGTLRNYLSTEKFNIACPWHGIEFDLETGIDMANKNDRLRTYEVIVDDGTVKVKV